MSCATLRRRDDCARWADALARPFLAGLFPSQLQLALAACTAWSSNEASLAGLLALLSTTKVASAGCLRIMMPIIFLD